MYRFLSSVLASGRQPRELSKRSGSLQAAILLASLLSSACSLAPPDPVANIDDAVAYAAPVYRPSEQLEELFVDVQMQPVFGDSKTFVDSHIEGAPSDILTAYRNQRSARDFELSRFVADYFAPPASSKTEFAFDPTRGFEQHLRSHWSYLARDADKERQGSTLIPLPHPYVVPGGRFREIYYWDSYFTMQGLMVSGREDLALGMLQNFAWLIEQFGHVPNGNRSYYLSRSQPPFFAAMVRLYQQHAGAAAAAEFLPALVQEHAFWMSGASALAPGETSRRALRLEDGSLLNRYYDSKSEPRPESYREDVKTAGVLPEPERPRLYRDIRAAAESGWDFSSRWFSDETSLPSIETTQIIPVDLNSLLYELESVISELSAKAGKNAQAEEFAAKAYSRKKAINRWLWNERRDIYGDYHIGDKRFTGIDSLAMVYPLYFNLASPAQAKAVAEALQEQFLMPGGLVTTLNHTGEQWDYPNGWAPLQWLAIAGLARYGHEALSEDIARRWLELNRKVFATTGRMMEKYNVVDTSLPAGGGEYPLQDGFGWTNGVALKIMEMSQQDDTQQPERDLE